MSTPPLTKMILDQVQELPEDLQYRVLFFIQSLKTTPPNGIPGKDLLKFAGMIPPEDLDAIEKAIEEDCERIDVSEW